MMDQYLKPMLPAPDLNSAFKGYKFPLYASLMLNGMRVTVQGGQFVSSKLRPVPNLYLQSLVRPWMERLDGDLIVGASNADQVFNVTQSALKSVHGRPDVRFYISDYMPDGNASVDVDTGKLGFDYRYSDVLQRYLSHVDDSDNCTTILTQHLVETQNKLDVMEAAALSHGYSGLLVRQIDGPYKHGRCTQREGYILKMQPFAQGEAEIIGYEPYYKNTNRITLNNLGRAVRSSHARGRTPMLLLGALVVRDVNTRVQFKIGGGFTREDRAELWDTRESLAGRVVLYKHSTVGVKNKPIQPIFLDFK